MAIPSAPLSVVVIIKGSAKISIVEAMEGLLETGNEFDVPVIETCNAGFGVAAEAILSSPGVFEDFCENDGEPDGPVDSTCDSVLDEVVEADMASVDEVAPVPG